jgi:hypothetical protein
MGWLHAYVHRGPCRSGRPQHHCDRRRDARHGKARDLGDRRTEKRGAIRSYREFFRRTTNNRGS